MSDAAVTAQLGRIALASTLGRVGGLDRPEFDWLRLAQKSGQALADYERPYWDESSESYILHSGASQIPGEDERGEVLLEILPDRRRAGVQGWIHALGGVERVHRERSRFLRRVERRWWESRTDRMGCAFDGLAPRALLVHAAPTIRRLVQCWEEEVLLELPERGHAPHVLYPSDEVEGFALPGREILGPQEREALRRAFASVKP